MSDFLSVAEKWLNDGELFREAVERTARETGFASELIEKDVFGSLALSVLTPELAATAVFKGGTCLSKVYAGFYRLSEDLDFAVPVARPSTRRKRRQLMNPVKKICAALDMATPALSVVQTLRGANHSTQYVQVLGYESCITGRTGEIKLEFGVREPLLQGARQELAGTLLVSPITGNTIFPPFPVFAMTIKEIWTEKIRAALTRREPAIRDFFDLDHAVLNLGLDLNDVDLHELIRKKLEVPGNDPVDMSAAKRRELKSQVQTQLRAVLREPDFVQFDFDRAFAAIGKLAERLEG